MERFDWQTEEEGSLTPLVAPAPGRSRRGRAAAAIVALLILVATLIVWQVGRQETIHEREVQEDVKAAFGLWQQAVARQDSDLLGTLLMDGEPSWTATQRELLESGRALDRSEAGLTLVEDVPKALDADVKIEVGRDWRSAEITFPVTYTRPADGGGETTVRLEQTVSLTRDGSRWLLRKPEEAFWGDWSTSTGKIAAITFRERDRLFARRFLADLDRDLSQRCATAAAGEGCPADTTVSMRLESDPAVLFREIDPDSPAFVGRTFVLPSPTLLGKPLDEASYAALYSLYSGPIMKTFEGSVATPERWPEQIVDMICFERNGNLPYLFRYDPAADFWTPEIEGAALQFLTASDDDTQVALRQHMPQQPNRLRVVLWSGGQLSVLHDETYDALTETNVGWIKSAGQSQLLLSEFEGTTRRPTYYTVASVDSGVINCPATGCPSRQMDGFPRWSPGGQHSLVQIDQRIYFADGDGRSQTDLGEGHDPFWLDDEHYGFIRPFSGEQRQIQEVAIGAIGGSELYGLWNTTTLTPSMIGAAVDSPFFIQHVATTGVAQRRILLYGRQYAGEDSRFVVLSLLLDAQQDSDGRLALAGPARVEVTLDQAPAEFPSPEGPNGHVPFVVSPDGRWLTVAHLAEKRADEWIIRLMEIGQDNELRFSTSYPGYAFKHPFLDWSNDGHWLLIVDREFVRLAAPDWGYERIVAHDKSNCSYPAWLNRQSDG